MEVKKKFYLNPNNQKEEELIKEIKNLKILGCSIDMDERNRNIIVKCPTDVNLESLKEITETRKFEL